MKIVYIGNLLANKNKTPTTIDTLSVYLRKEGYNVKTFSDKSNFVYRLLNMLYGIYKNKDTHVVLIDTYSSLAFWYFVFVGWLCIGLKLNFIPYLHGGNLPTRLDKNPKICKWLFSKSYINIAPSEYLKFEFEKRGYKNVLLIPNTIEIKEYPFKNERNLSTPKLLWVRSFASLYNPKMAIDVLFELIKKYPDAQLCMVGPEKDGSLEECKQYAAQKNVKILFTGKLSKKEWVKLSEEYNFFINTTNFDNTPVSVIEAMALGVPVISTNVGGIPFLVKDRQNGILISKQKSFEMVDAISMLINNKDLYNKIQIKARAEVEKLDWQQTKKSWFTLFEKLK